MSLEVVLRSRDPSAAIAPSLAPGTSGPVGAMMIRRDALVLSWSESTRTGRRAAQGCAEWVERRRPA
jgi:hypothetical protein